MTPCDVAVIGGGPAGSTLATLLGKQGRKVVLFEKESFPRFHIGESLLPYSMPVFRETGFFDILNSGKYIKKYGARFVDGSTESEICFEFKNGLDPNENLAFEVPRAEFDSDLLKWARECGVEVSQPDRVTRLDFLADHVEITSSRRTVSAKFVVDASGRDCLLGKQKKIREGIDDLQRVAVFAHYQGVKRTKGKREGDITIGMLRDGGWMWNIPFLGDTSSVGVVRPTSIVRDPENLKNVIEESLAASRILRSNMKDAHRITSVQVVSNYAHVCSAFHGERWMLLGDAAAFLDPIFSSGVHLSVCSAKFAAEALLGALHSNEHLTMSDHGQKYEQKCRTGIRRFHSLIHLFYESRFIDRMKKALSLANTRKAFTSAIAGDVWNDDNFVFEKGVL